MRHNNGQGGDLFDHIGRAFEGGDGYSEQEVRWQGLTLCSWSRSYSRTLTLALILTLALTLTLALAFALTLALGLTFTIGLTLTIALTLALSVARVVLKRRVGQRGRRARGCFVRLIDSAWLQVSKIVLWLAKGLQFMHRHGVSHG